MPARALHSRPTNRATSRALTSVEGDGLDPRFTGTLLTADYLTAASHRFGMFRWFVGLPRTARQRRPEGACAP